MAFIRRRQSSWKQHYTWYSFQLIETYRDGGKVRQRVLWNIGTAQSAADAIRRYGGRLPEQYREQVMGLLECMARSEPSVEQPTVTLEEVEQKLRRALGRA
jgi:hypothetical protein